MLKTNILYNVLLKINTLTNRVTHRETTEKIFKFFLLNVDNYYIYYLYFTKF